MKSRPLFSIVFVVFIDLLGFSLILPLLPYYAETFRANSFITGLLVASYAAAQLVGNTGKLNIDRGNNIQLTVNGKAWRVTESFAVEMQIA